MKIKKISTEQFAGIRGKEIELSDGVNVIYGQNESGKSTLVRLLFGLLFRDTKGRSKDIKDFESACLPAERKDGQKFDFIDGTLVLESDKGEYKLTKQWGEDPQIKLAASAGITKNRDRINKTLEEILKYGEGVYREMLLSPQSSAADNLKAVFDHKDETGKTLAEAVSEAYAESDGIATDKIEAKINEKIEELSKYWNIEKHSGVPKSDGGVREKGGTVFNAWKQFKDLEKKHYELIDIEEDSNKKSKIFSEKAAAVDELEHGYNEFLKYAESLRVLKTNEELAKRADADIAVYGRDLAAYPKAKRELENAQKLQKELLDRNTLNCYNEAKKYHDQEESLKAKLESLSCPGEDEIKRLKAAEREIPRLKNELRGMNIAAKLKTLGGNSVKITSALTGEEIKLDGENAVITEAVRIEIPGVMEMELAPANVNIDEVNEKISGLKNSMTEIFAKYGCKTIGEIEELAKNYNSLKLELAAAENNFKTAVKVESSDYAELENAAKAVKDPDTVRTMEQIADDIAKFASGQSIEGFIGAKQTDLDRFVENYGSMDGLNERIKKRTDEFEAAKREIAAAGNVPEEYKNITDIDAAKTIMKTKVDNARIEKENALKAKIEAEASLAEFINKYGDDLSETVQMAEKDFRDTEELLKNWLHIRDVLTEQRGTIKSNPLQDLAKHFAENLKVISAGSVDAEFTDPGKPNFEITSKDYKLDFAKLSDGTRETVYLAFRLAVLDHLFPDGGGVMVLDDPLNDMDAGRVDKACEIIKKSAGRHQIIFLTCREEYAAKLGAANVITLNSADNSAAL